MNLSLIYNLKVIIISTSIALALTYPALATSGKDIREVITKFLEEQGYNSNPLIKDNRSFSDCSNNLKVKTIFKDFKTLLVTCDAPLKWKIALRTNAIPFNSLKNNSSKNKISPGSQNVALVLSSSLKKGEVIKNSDVYLKQSKTSIGRGYFTDTKKLIGRKLKQNLSLGQIIRSRHLEENWMIQKGQSITINSNFSGVNVSMNGKALENGHFQQLIKVSNLSSGKVIQGRIMNQKNILIKY